MNSVVPIRTRIVDLIFRRVFWFALGLWAGCAHSRTPYTEEIAVRDFIPDWEGDREPGVLRVVNPLGSSVSVAVACLSDSGNAERWNVDVAPHGSTTVLFQKLAKNWATNVCHVEDWRRR